VDVRGDRRAVDRELRLLERAEHEAARAVEGEGGGEEKGREIGRRRSRGEARGDRRAQGECEGQGAA